LWITWGWYVLMTLAMLYFWQEASHAVSSKTIPYSEFMQRLAEGRVVQCTVAQDEITGGIDPSRHLTKRSTPLATSGPATLSAAAPELVERAKPSTEPAQATVKTGAGLPPGEQHPSTEPARAQVKTLPTGQPEQPFNFRTIRVEDPNLVQDLEAGDAKFDGVRPSVLSQVLWSWIIPINKISTGPENDLEHATALERQMVCVYGMSPTVGLAQVAHPQTNPFLSAGATDGAWQRDCSEQTAREVDEEVKRIMGDAYDQARNILRQHRDGARPWTPKRSAGSLVGRSTGSRRL